MTTIAAFLHGYPPEWSMGGEVSTHRTLRAVPGSVVFTHCREEYFMDGVHVKPMSGPKYDDIMRDAESVGATVLYAHSSLSANTVRAARRMKIPSILAVHAPPQYATDLRRAWSAATVRLYNTGVARAKWNDPMGWLLHPPAALAESRPLRDGPHDAYVLTSSLLNKGVTETLLLARLMPERRFIIVESPAHGTHGSPAFWDEAAELPNVAVWPRVHPDQMRELWEQARILLVPSRYETYGMSAVEAASHGVPSVHVDTPHVREGIGVAAELVNPRRVEDIMAAIERIEADYDRYQDRVRFRARELAAREERELARFAAGVAALSG